MEKRIETLEHRAPPTEDLRKALGSLDDRLTGLSEDMARQAKRKNLVFTGFGEEAGERGPQLRDRVKEALDALQTELQDANAVATDSWSSQISFVTRLGRATSGRPRMILARFKSDLAVERLWDCRQDIRLLLGSSGGPSSVPEGFMIRRDLTQRQLQIRRDLRPVHDLAWAESRTANSRIQRAFFAEEKLFVVPTNGAPLPVVLLSPDTRWRSLFSNQAAVNEIVFGPVQPRTNASDGNDVPMTDEGTSSRAIVPVCP